MKHQTIIATLLAALLPGCVLIDDPITGDSMTDTSDDPATGGASSTTSSSDPVCDIYAFELLTVLFPYTTDPVLQDGTSSSLLLQCELAGQPNSVFDFTGTPPFPVLGADVRSTGEDSWAEVAHDVFVCAPQTSVSAPLPVEYTDFVGLAIDSYHSRCWSILTNDHGCKGSMAEGNPFIPGAVELCYEYMAWPYEDQLLTRSGTASFVPATATYPGSCPSTTALSCGVESSPFGNPGSLASCSTNPCTYDADVMESPEALAQMAADGFLISFSGFMDSSTGLYDPPVLTFDSNSDTEGVFAQLGIESGDTITYLDGVPVEHMGSMFTAWMGLFLPGATVDVEVYRPCSTRGCDPTFEFTLKRSQ